MESRRIKSVFARWHYETMAVVLVFLAILIVGLIVFDDYGVAYDDPVERETTLANLKYIVATFAPSMELPDALASAPNLFEWKDRHYGVAAQIPSALVEWAFGFDLYSSRIYKIRHLWVFIQFYIALIFFYFLLKRRFRSSVLALTGVLTLFLTPRIFADSFYNVKDSVFLSWGILSFYALIRWIERPTRTNLILLGAAFAVLINTRVIGALVPAIGLGILFLFWRRGELSARDWIQQSFILAVSTIVFWIVITPYAWHNPLQVLFETIDRFSSFPIKSMELYLGKLIANDALPWHYLPVWIAVSMPTVTLIGWFGGAASFFGGLRNRWGEDTEWKWVCADGAVFIWGVFPILIAILLDSTLYDGWRHFYFIVPTLVYFMIFGFERVRKSRFVTAKRIAYAIAAASVIYQGFWILRNHPYEMVSFNEFTPLETRMGFEKDYWCMSCSRVIQTILERDPSLRIVAGIDDEALENQLLGFSPEDAARIVPAGVGIDYSELDFYLENMTKFTESEFDFPAFQKVYEISVDQVPIINLFQRVRDRLVSLAEVSIRPGEGPFQPVPELSDWDRKTDFKIQNKPVQIQLDLKNIAKISGISLLTVERRIGIPEEVQILSSLDGAVYRPVNLQESSYSEFFFEPVEAGYLRIESDDLDGEWYLSEIQVWKAAE